MFFSKKIYVIGTLVLLILLGFSVTANANSDERIKIYKEKYEPVFIAYDAWVINGVENNTLRNVGKDLCDNSLAEGIPGIIRIFAGLLKINADPCDTKSYNLQFYGAISPTTMRYTSADWEKWTGNASAGMTIYENINMQLIPNTMVELTNYYDRLDRLDTGELSGAVGQDLGLPLRSFVYTVFLEFKPILEGGGDRPRCH
ncbi:hypothetical protein N9K37_05405 [Pseudomonadales bacterium]|nr:hypothetical protein [Pseudomonadales bacterium]